MRTRSKLAVRKSSRALVLLVSLGILAILAVLGSVFVTLARVESETSANYSLSVRARMLAESGMEFAFARLRDGRSLGRVPYGGEDWNGGGEATGTPDGNADDFHGNQNGVVEISTCDLRYARRPSFFADEDGNGLPDLLPVREGGAIRLRGFSGRLPGTFHDLGDSFVLQVIDTSGLVSINQTGDGYRQFYDNLGTLLLGVTGLGAAIQGGQPYATVDELMARGAVTPAQIEVLRPYLTVDAWIDKSVIHPDPQPDSFLRPEALRRLDHLEPRAPINVNTADEVVLEACLLGLSGYNTDRIVPRKKSFTLSASTARSLAQAIVAARSETFQDVNGNGRYDAGEPFVDRDGNGRFDGPFGTWEQFADFVEGVPGVGSHGHGVGVAASTWPCDLVLANANPNTRLNCLSPDHQLRRSIDKADLISHTTEFCFESAGRFLIRSLGRITNAQFEVVAETEIECGVQMWEVVRLSTQEEFETATDRSATGPDVMTVPEETAQIATESYADVDGSGNFGFGDTFADGNGDGARDGPAIYDGQITLRPADPPIAQPWGDAPSAIAFRCLFNDSHGVYALGPDAYPSLTADIASPTPDRGAPLMRGDLQTTIDQGGSLLKDRNGAHDYADLGPTGLLVRHDTGEAIYWDSILNWPVGEGSIRFWVRPTWETHPAANQYKDLLTLNQQFSIDPNRGRIAQLSAVHFGPNPGIFFLDSTWYSRSRETMATETADDTGFNPPPFCKTRYQLNLKNGWAADQWHDVSLRYSDQVVWHAWLDAEAFRPVSETRVPGGGEFQLSNPSPTYNHMTLGSDLPWAETIGNGTYDDFVIYRTAVPFADVGLTPAWRYADTGFAGWSQWVGRVRLPGGTQVRSIAWTEARPTLNYLDEPLSSRATLARQRRPDVHASYRMAGEPAFHDVPRPIDPDGYDGGACAVGSTLPPTGNLEMRFTFDRGGQDPFRNAPAVDDVTVTYCSGAGVRVLSWRILP